MESDKREIGEQPPASLLLLLSRAVTTASTRSETAQIMTIVIRVDLYYSHSRMDDALQIFDKRSDFVLMLDHSIADRANQAFLHLMSIKLCLGSYSRFASWFISRGIIFWLIVLHPKFKFVWAQLGSGQGSPSCGGATS